MSKPVIDNINFTSNAVRSFVPKSFEGVTVVSNNRYKTDEINKDKDKDTERTNNSFSSIKEMI